jgi:DNA repair protein RadC
MYSPKIKEALISRLYQISKTQGKPMTKVVNEILERAINNDKGGKEKIKSGIKYFNLEFLEVREATSENAYSPKAVAELMKQESRIDRECFWVFHLNCANRIIEKELVALGTINSAPINPREIFKKAILIGSMSIITIHNHPSDSCSPSNEDKTIWERLNEVGKIVGIEILDHLIITPSGNYYSKKEGDN